MNNIKRLKNIIKDSNSIVLFTGAGISVPSGIPDFRSASGLYNQKYDDVQSPETIISNTFLQNNPQLFFKFYKKHLVYPNAKPNKAHFFFSKLEKAGKLKCTITQNVDNFHQISGSKNVYELHGSVHRNFCTKCNKSFDLDFILKSTDVPYCDICGAIIKPDVVLFGDTLEQDVINVSIAAIESCDTLIIVGTSLVVYPAAGLIRHFRGDNLVLINKQKTKYDSAANIVLNKDIIKVIEVLEMI